jgi:hypothetical protein
MSAFLLQEATDPVLKEIYEKFLAPNIKSLPKSPMDGLQKVCDESRYAIAIDSFDVRQNARKLTCELLPVPHAYFWVPASFIINKKSPYKELFSH